MKAQRLACSLALALTALAGIARGADYHYVHLAVPSPTEAVRWYTQHMECDAIPERTDAVACGSVEILFGVRPTVGGSPGTGVDHIGFSYADLTAEMERLERVGVGGRGVRLQRFDDGSTLREVAGLVRHGFVFDPWGTRIELVEDAGHVGFHHIHLSSSDPDAALAWYEDTFGGERAALNGQIDGLLFDNVWLLVSAHPEGMPAPTEGRAIDHLGFLVPDLDEAAASLGERGIAFERPPESGRTSARRAFLAGPDNVTLSVVEPGWLDRVNERPGSPDSPDSVAAAGLEPYTTPRTPAAIARPSIALPGTSMPPGRSISVMDTVSRPCWNGSRRTRTGASTA